MFCDSHLLFAAIILCSILQDSGDACSQLALCTKSTRTMKTRLMSTKPEAPVECTVCKALVDELKNLLTANETVVEVEQALDSLCEKLPALKSEVRYTVVCKSVVFSSQP